MTDNGIVKAEGVFQLFESVAVTFNIHQHVVCFMNLVDRVGQPDAALAVVMGAEGEGLRRLTLERCDDLIAIPMAGDVQSLNVSVATGVVLFHIRARRPA